MFGSVNAQEGLHPDTPLFSGSELVYQKTADDRAHQFLLSTPKRIDNALYIEKEQRVAGVRTNTLLKMLPGFDEKEVFAFYKAFIASKGQLMYACEQRACGSSNYWANNIFNERALYGRDSNQYYLAGKVNLSGVPNWFSAYIVQNGRKDHYIYLSSVPVTDSLSVEDWQQGMHYDNIPLSEPVISFLKKVLEAQPELKLYVAGHSRSQETKTLSQHLRLTEALTQKVQRYLLRQLEIPETRIVVESLGPFGVRPGNILSNQWFSLYLLKP